MPSIARLLEIYRFAIEHPIEQSGHSDGFGRKDAPATRCPRDHALREGAGSPGRIPQAWRDPGREAPWLGCGRPGHLQPEQLRARTVRGALRSVPSSFGAFTLAFITYTVVINAARGLATDPLLVRFSGDPSSSLAPCHVSCYGDRARRRRGRWAPVHRCGAAPARSGGAGIRRARRRTTGACPAGQLAVRVLRLRSRRIRIHQ